MMRRPWGIDVPEELAEEYKLARQKSKLAGIIRGSYKLRDAIMKAGHVIRRVRIAAQRGGAGTKRLPPDVIDLAAQRLKRDSE